MPCWPATHVPVVFTRYRYRSGHVDFGPLFPQFRDLPQVKQDLLAHTWDADIIDDLEFGPSDLAVDKARLDAFYNTSVDTLLRSMGIVRIAVAGVITNACAETSPRSAAMRDCQVTVLCDCMTSGQGAAPRHVAGVPRGVPHRVWCVRSPESCSRGNRHGQSRPTRTYPAADSYCHQAERRR